MSTPDTTPGGFYFISLCHGAPLASGVDICGQKLMVSSVVIYEAQLTHSVKKKKIPYITEYHGICQILDE